MFKTEVNNYNQFNLNVKHRELLWHVINYLPRKCRRKTQILHRKSINMLDLTDWKKLWAKAKQVRSFHIFSVSAPISLLFNNPTHLIPQKWSFVPEIRSIYVIVPRISGLFFQIESIFCIPFSGKFNSNLSVKISR